MVSSMGYKVALVGVSVLWVGTVALGGWWVWDAKHKAAQVVTPVVQASETKAVVATMGSDLRAALVASTQAQLKSAQAIDAAAQTYKVPPHEDAAVPASDAAEYLAAVCRVRQSWGASCGPS